VPEPVNATAAALLGLLRDGPASGYDLHQRAAAELGDFWTVTRSQVYRELAALVERGLVTAVDSGARARREHSLTADGARAFEEWMVGEPAGEVVRIPLLLRLAFVDALPAQRLREMVAASRATHAARLQRYELLEQAALEIGGTDGDLVTLRFGLRYERAVLAWLDEDVEGLDALSGSRG
jgi:DNA-binding PadR family transcriptional regulator